MILFFHTIILSLISCQNINEYVYYIENSQIIKTNINSGNVEIIEFDNPDIISLDKYEMIVKESGYFLINDASGIVYKMENNSLTRIDKSLDNRLMKDSYVFTHNDTIFRYGGYGFWSQRNFMIYFDEDVKEWELYSNRNNSFIPEGSYKGVHFKNDSDIYFIGGLSVDRNNLIDSKKNTEVVKYNFNDRSFKYLGELNFHFNYSSLIVKDNDGFAVNDGTQIAYVKPSENLIEFYNKTPLQLNLFRSETKKNSNKFYNNNYAVELFRNNDLGNDIVKISKTDFFNTKTSEMRLYRNKILHAPTITTLLLLFILLVTIIYIIDRFRFNSIVLNSRGIIYRRILNNLSIKEINFMNQIIKESFISTKSVLKIVENTNLSYPHNIKIKDQFIKELNLKLKTIFNTDYTPLEVRSSKIDARIKEHFFNKNFNKFIKRLSVRI